MEAKKCTAVVLAAGRGRRMGGVAPKQFMELGGRPLLYYSLAAFQASACIDAMVVVTGAESIEYVRTVIIERYGFSKTAAVVAGGDERYDSVWNGLKAVAALADGTLKEGCVLIHDGARPFIDDGIIKRSLEAVADCRACVVGMPSKDTVKIADDEGFVCDTPDRSRVWSVQTPQGFDFAVVYEAYRRLMESGGSATDDASVVERFTDVKVRLVEGSYRNIKITTPEDLEAAEAFLGCRADRR